ncbi:MAG: HD domain-containing protein [Desulfamplus sp.]|nr:HD domain-containing protein [Desulfamplus sp.]MBF0241738.1 HD domain-containing protein [Desulfamplus sp.]MBF0389348.1 HD domain-containing protein [Desulfamplus sp.]
MADNTNDSNQLLYFPLGRLGSHESIFKDAENGVFTEKYRPIFTPILGKQLALNTYYKNDLIAAANTPITIGLLRVFDELKINFKVNSRDVTDDEKNIALDATISEIIKSKTEFLDSIKKEDVPIIQQSVHTFLSNALTQNNIEAFQSHYQQVKGYLEFANSVITSDKKYIGTAAALKRLIENEQHQFQLRKDQIGETIEHSLKTAWISLVLAVELDDFDESDCKKLSIICMAHDCGKALIPKDIIYKNGRLSQLESDIMKSHVLLSYILSSNNQKNLEFEPFVMAMHHIKENKDIPQSYSISHDTKFSFFDYLIPEAQNRIRDIYDATVKYYRLMNITDTFEAITAERVYKKASSIGKTIDIMTNDNKNGDFFYPPYLDKLIQFVVKTFLPKNMIFRISDEMLDTYYQKDKFIVNEKEAYQKSHRGVIINPSSHIEEPLECVIFNHKTKQTERKLTIPPRILLNHKYIT